MAPLEAAAGGEAPDRSDAAPFAGPPGGVNAACVGVGGRGASRAGLGPCRSRLTHFLLLNSYRNSYLIGFV